MYLPSRLQKSLIFCLIFFDFLLVSGQGRNQQDSDFTNSAEIIVEGNIIDSESFWDRQHRNIYTSYTLEVENVNRSQVPKQIKILEKGGKVDSTWQLVSTSINLSIGDKGTFLLIKFHDSTILPEQNWFVLHNGNKGVLGLESKTVKTINLYSKNENQKSATATHKIDSIAPKVVTAGTGTLLTIFGSGFGEKVDTNRVWFTYSDMAYHIYSNSGFEYKTWTDNQIQIYVPTKAATGQIAVVKDGVQVLSDDSLTVKYACTTSIWGYSINLINIDDQGGYTWDLNLNLNTILGAKELVIDAINEWVCTTSVPWKIGDETTTEPGKDGKCTISFGEIENSNTAMGETSISAISHPSSGNEAWVLEEVDILLSEDKEYCITGNCASTNGYDLKTIILHELAHALLIDHVNDPNDLMHYGLAEGELRDIGETNIECANYILNLSQQLAHPEYSTIVPYQFAKPAISVDGNVLASEQEFQQYQWYNEGGKIEGATNKTYTVERSGEYYLLASNEFECELKSETVNIALTSINSDTRANEVLLYPNPVSETLFIQMNQNTFTEVLFYDAFGQRILNKSLDPGKKLNTVNIKNLSAGIYIVVLRNSEKSINKKIMVQ